MTTTKTVHPQQVAATISADLKNWEGITLEEAKRALLRCGFAVEKEAKKLAPVDTGTLRASIHTEQPEDDMVVVMDGVAYGVFLEYGTSKMKAQPFLRPAVWNTEHERKVIFEEEVGRGL